MINSRIVVVMLLSGGLLAGGCQSNSTATIAEYRPHQRLAEQRAPDSEVFQLIRWTPVSPPVATTHPGKTAKHPARQMPVEVEQVYVPRGQTIGFRRDDGKLIAIADADTQPLPEAHYEWKTLPGHPGSQSQGDHPRWDQIVETVGVVAVIAGVVAVVVWILHDGRHSTCDCD
jgi:hypothetical protein